MWSNSAFSALIDEHINSERDRSILRRRFIDGLTFDALAYEYKMSVSQIRRIVNRRGKPLLMILKRAENEAKETR